jgi:hypothetical protein
MVTSIAPVQDGELTDQIHDGLATVGLSPAEHAVDAAYVSPARIERGQRVHGITLLGPVVPDHSHQAKSAACFDKAAFAIDWDRRQATCPTARPAGMAAPAHHGHDYIQVKFDKATCLACPVRPQCTDAVSGPRSLALLPTRELHKIQQRNRLNQQPARTHRPGLQRHSLHLRVDHSARGLPPDRERALGDGACQTVNDVGKPYAGEPHVRFEAAGTGNRASRHRASPRPILRSVTSHHRRSRLTAVRRGSNNFALS